MPFGVVSGVGPGIHVLDGSPHASIKGKGLFLAWFPASGIFVQCFRMATYGYTDILIDERLVCEKLTIFPYAEYIAEFCVRLAFL